jgi:hypothetical protein
MLATGTLMVKSVHCVLIPHDYQNIASTNGQASFTAGKADSCPICSFDFFPVVLHSLKVLPDVAPFLFAKQAFNHTETPVKQVSYLYLLRAPPVV